MGEETSTTCHSGHEHGNATLGKIQGVAENVEHPDHHKEGDHVGDQGLAHAGEVGKEDAGDEKDKGFDAICLGRVQTMGHPFNRTLLFTGSRGVDHLAGGERDGDRGGNGHDDKCDHGVDANGHALDANAL